MEEDKRTCEVDAVGCKDCGSRSYWCGFCYDWHCLNEECHNYFEPK